MRVRKKKVSEECHYCYVCGKELKTAIIVSFGKPSPEYDVDETEYCTACARKMKNQLEKALSSKADSTS